MGREHKDDEVDAELLARIGRLDPRLLKPVTLRSEQTQSALSVLRSRDVLVPLGALEIEEGGVLGAQPLIGTVGHVGRASGLEYTGADCRGR